MVANQNGVAIVAELVSGLNRRTFWLLGLPCTDNNMNNLKNNTKRVPRQRVMGSDPWILKTKQLRRKEEWNQ